MSINALTESLRHHLSPHLERSGSILYSATSTLKVGDVYLMGFNPGGGDGPTISEQIDALADRTTNAYLDEEWTGKAGEAPLQRRVTWVLKALGYQPREVCASNLIFIRSRDYRGVEYTLADECWPVHEEIISIVQPKLILVFGNSATSPYDYLRNRFNAGGADESISSGHGSWTVRSFNTVINGQSVCVVGLPHLSRYSPVGKPEVIEWIKTRKQHAEPDPD
ncbi:MULTISPECIES: uracil-DNA glycosylase family protein [unclassified Leclercia]|uniref:Uracil-DNA glycosylase-like domain-containing protein n=1 Tax=Leclercia barmai TaxID=2785629 RepID=A0ABS7RYV0_9ENTR|nr:MULTISPECIES: uracil-DNA glycosylase family protein [unclassified Leclercia]MBZ0059486.1 hypothetical protein [Leclercia sp. EMC7]MCM5697382.1 uracil-DNA glycosylase family protein [Leclercia sp. LTM01]MCM5702024.1 uracil-DNA glycosylase family protein [Leclercia sp. LTM14]